MKRVIWLLSMAVAVSLLSLSPSASAQVLNKRLTISIPASNTAPSVDPDTGELMAHTNLRIIAPEGRTNFGPAVNPNGPPVPGLLFETPASIACIYKLVEIQIPGCNPNLTTADPTGGSRAIAIVDAFDDPTAASDLAVFDAQFGLPAADITVVFAQGTRPGLDPTGGFELEEALDTQWAHAMAPAAKIFLVEAANNSFRNLFAAAVVASNLVAAAGGGEVSMSFGASEAELSAAFEQANDPTFTTPGVVYFASAGDSPGTIYPSTSPNVVSAGGTSISRNTTTGNFIVEGTWQDAGGGPSLFEPRPAFQNPVKNIVGPTRGTPDFSFDANPTSGVFVFNTNPVDGTGFFVVGGTSVAAPSLSGIVNAANTFNTSSQAENTELINHRFNGNQVRDIVVGDCGLNISDFAVIGWDFCTGVGSDLGLKGK